MIDDFLERVQRMIRDIEDPAELERELREEIERRFPVDERRRSQEYRRRT